MVAAACYSHGVLLLADAAGLEGRSRLLAVFQDLTSPPAASWVALGRVWAEGDCDGAGGVAAR